jgi:hypothetical protein
MAVLKRVCEETPRPVREVNPEVPDWLAAIIARLHAKNPAKRYQSAAEVADLLGQHLARLQQPGMTPADPPPAVAEPRTQRVFERSKRSGRTGRLLRFAACAALIGVGCVALYWIFWRPQETANGTNGAAQEAPPWKPRPPLTLEELAKLPSPLDALKREAMELPEDAPPELLAVLGDPVRFPLPAQTTTQLPTTQWMARIGDGRLLAVPWWTTARVRAATGERGGGRARRRVSLGRSLSRFGRLGLGALERGGHVGPELVPGFALILGQLGQGVLVAQAGQGGIFLPALERPLHF